MHLKACYLLAFTLVPAFAAPTLQKRSPFEPGDIVGVWPDELEGKSKATKAVSIHPGVVLARPHPATGKFPVAMISKKLPNDPPQAPIQNFYHGSSLHGNVKLAPPKEISKAKPWKDEKTGGRQSPMNPAGVQKLKDAMKPHEGWRSPSPQRPATPGSRIPVLSRPPSPHTATPPGPKGKQKQGQATPGWRPPSPVNAHASGSRIPVLSRPSSPAPPNHAARKSNPATAAPRRQLKQPAAQRPNPPRGSSSKPPAAPKQPPRPANRSPPRPGSPSNKPASNPSKPKDKKGKQPVRVKREFIRGRAVSLY